MNLIVFFFLFFFLFFHDLYNIFISHKILKKTKQSRAEKVFLLFLLQSAASDGPDKGHPRPVAVKGCKRTDKHPVIRFTHTPKLLYLQVKENFTLLSFVSHVSKSVVKSCTQRLFMIFYQLFNTIISINIIFTLTVLKIL